MSVVKYTEESRQLRLHDAVEYFGLSVAVVFLVIEGTYTSKEREAVSKGENYLLVTGHVVYIYILEIPLVFGHLFFRG